MIAAALNVAIAVASLGVAMLSAFSAIDAHDQGRPASAWGRLAFGLVMFAGGVCLLRGL